MAPPVVQPKLGRQKKAELPEWQSGTSTAVDPFVQLKETMALQAKLAIGQPNNKYEQEADRVAQDVVQRIRAPITNTAEPGPVLNFKSYLQRSSALTGGEASTELESSINRAKGGGQSLDQGLQQSMGNAMGADFSSVKVHTDSTSDQLNRSMQARAFTTGNNVFFKKGEYNPGSKGGQELIAHELTHVVQQGAAGSAVQRSGDTVIQPWLEDRKGNVLNEKIAIKFLVENKINEDLARSLVSHARTLKTPVRKAELLRTGRWLNATSWTPEKWGANLFSDADPSDPDKKLTAKIVNNEDLDQYIEPDDQQDILDFLPRNHGVGGAVSPAYWANDPVSQSSNFARITNSNLRPVVTIGSFAGPTGTVPSAIYRGSGLSPLKLFEYDGFRAWGLDDDLYFHTMQAQTERRHSAYVATTDQINVAIKFSSSQKTPFIYDINLDGLFPIRVGALTQYSGEGEYVVPYHIPFSSVEAVRPQFGPSEGTRIPIPHDQGELAVLDKVMELEMEVSEELFRKYMLTLEQEATASLKQDEEQWQALKQQHKDSLKIPELLLPGTEPAFLEVLMGKNAKASLQKLKKAKQKENLKLTSLNALYNACRRVFDKLTLDTGNGQKRSVDIPTGKKIDKTAKQAFFDLVADWWFNCYKPQQQA